MDRKEARDEVERLEIEIQLCKSELKHSGAIKAARLAERIKELEEQHRAACFHLKEFGYYRERERRQRMRQMA